MLRKRNCWRPNGRNTYWRGRFFWTYTCVDSLHIARKLLKVFAAMGTTRWLLTGGGFERLYSTDSTGGYQRPSRNNNDLQNL